MLLRRDVFTPTYTLGALLVDLGSGPLPFGATCEDYDDGTDSPVYAKADWGRLCIPAGRYRVAWTMSARFGHMAPLLLDVPGRRGIRIHAGNTEVDTEGCILPGLHVAADGHGVAQSRVACNWLYPRIEKAAAQSACWIEVSRAPGTLFAPRAA